MADHKEKAKDFRTEHTQTASDEEIFEQAKISPKKLDRTKIDMMVNGVIAFGEALADLKLYPYEIEFAKRIVLSLLLNDGDTVTGLFCRQSGKSTTCGLILPAAGIMLPLYAEVIKQQGIDSPILMYEKGFWCGVYGPDYERAGLIGNKINTTLSSARARTILSEKEIGMSFPERISNYVDLLPRGSRINVKSANLRVSIEGDTWHCVVTDETQEIPNIKLTKSISPMLASTNGTTVHIGSVATQRVYFYDVIKTNKEEDTKRAKKKRCHFEIDYREAQKYNKKYKKYIAKEKKKLGEFSDEFKMSYENFWPLEKGMFITEEYLTSQCGKPYYVTNYDKTNIHVIAIDVAKTNDSTIVTVAEVDYDNPIVVDEESNIIRHNKKIKNWLEINGDDYDTQFYMICDFIDNYKWCKLIVDATGVGIPVFDRLKNRYDGRTFEGITHQVIPFVFTRPDKSYGYTLLYRELLANPPRIEFPNNDKAKALKKQRRFVEQMSNLMKMHDGPYLIVRHTKDTGQDDYPDSLMMLTVAVEDIDVGSDVEEFVQDIYKTPRSERPLIKTHEEENFWTSQRRN